MLQFIGLIMFITVDFVGFRFWVEKRVNLGRLRANNTVHLTQTEQLIALKAFM